MSTNKNILTIRMEPETRTKIEQWYKADNCSSMNEFVEKAIVFYADYLAIQSNRLLPIAVTSAIDGRLGKLERELRSISFRSDVEQDLMASIIAEAVNIDLDTLKRLRTQSVKNVKATNGSIPLEKKIRSRDEYGYEDDDEWQD